MAQMLSAAAQGDERYAGSNARDAAEALRQLTGGIHGICATVREAPSEKLINSGRDVMHQSLNLFEEVKVCLMHPGQPENQERLARVARAVTYSLSNCLSCLPGQQDIDAALENVRIMSETVSLHQMPPSARNYQEVQEDLLRCASQLSEATNRLAGSVGSPQHVLADSDPMVRQEMVEGLRSVANESRRLLESVKTTAADPTAPHLKQQLNAAARAVTESINRLIDICMSGAPWQKECDNALRSIMAMRHLLDNPDEPVNDLTYFECLDLVTEKSKHLGDGMTGIAHHAKRTELEPFCQSVREVADAVCGLAESAAQAAYLGIIHKFRDTSSQAQVFEDAQIIAKHTSTLANICRDASSRTSNPSAKRHFINCAKDVASSTAALIKVIKALDSDFSEPNKQECARATNPLIASLDSLTAFVNSPEFASLPAKISIAGRQAQEPIIHSGRRMLNGSCEMIQTAKLLAVNPKDPPTWQQLAGHSKTVSDSIKSLVSAIRDKAPGQTECDMAIEKMNHLIKILDQTSIAAINQSLPHRNDNTEQGFYELVSSSAMQVQERVEGIRIASKREAENLGHRVSETMSFYDPLVDGCLGGASLCYNSKRQMLLLDQCKTVAECQLQLLYSAKDSGGNPKATEFHIGVDESCDALKEALGELLQSVQTAVSEAGVVSSMVESISRSIARTDEQIQFGEPESGTYVDCQTRMVRACREIVRVSQEMVNKSYSDVSGLGPLALELSRHYAQLAEDSRGATAATAGSEISQRIRSSVQELGRACIDEVKQAGACRAQPNDQYAKKDLGIIHKLRVIVSQDDPLAEAARIVSEKVAFVLSALQSGSRGTQACINAASTVSGIIGDLDTTIMFATAGTLNPDREEDHFSDHRFVTLCFVSSLYYVRQFEKYEGIFKAEGKLLMSAIASPSPNQTSTDSRASASHMSINLTKSVSEAILKTAKALVEDTKALVAGAASSQEQLAVAAQNAVRTIVQLSDVVKAGAAALTSKNSEAQVLVIHAVKDVAAALASLIQATKNASGKSFNDPAMTFLKEAAKVMVTNVTSLLKTVKTVEDEHQRGTRALEAAIEAIAQEIRAYDSADAPARTFHPEEIVRASKPVTDATAKAVAAGQSCQQEDVIVAANLARKGSSTNYVTPVVKLSEHAVSDILLTTKSTAFSAESAEIRYKALDAGRDVAIKVRELLQALHLVLQKPGHENREVLIPASRSIAQAVTDLVSFGEILKGSDWVDPTDPTVIAENELLGAANSIEAAARKLALLKPRERARPADESLNFDEQILEAAKSIATAVQALVKAASVAQRELINQGRMDPTPSFTSEDYQWSEGLVSAARMVAAAVHSLCESANALVQGHASEEKLISAAKQVAASTAQLLVACKVKADMNSKAMQRLQAAGHAVKTATEHLVRAAKQSIDAEDERTLIISQRMVSGIAQVMDAQEEVLRKERELTEARVKLSAIRKAKYKDRPAGSHEGSPETPYYSDF